MAIPPEVRDDVDDVDSEGAAVATGKSSPASSATTSDVSDKTKDSMDADPTHQESSVYDGLSLSPASSGNEGVLEILTPGTPHIQPDFIIYPIDQSPTGSWGHPWDYFQGGADLPNQTGAGPPMHHDFIQHPTGDSGEVAQVGSGNSHDEDVGYSSDGVDSVVSDSSDISMDVNYNGYASKETRARGRAGREAAYAAATDTQGPLASGARVPSPATRVREFNNQFGCVGNVAPSADIQISEDDSSSDK